MAARRASTASVDLAPVGDRFQIVAGDLGGLKTLPTANVPTPHYKLSRNNEPR